MRRSWLLDRRPNPCYHPIRTYFLYHHTEDRLSRRKRRRDRNFDKLIAIYGRTDPKDRPKLTQWIKDFFERMQGKKKRGA